MADPSKTEKATPKRREKAKKEGNILRVQDLDATIMLWSNYFLLLALGAATFGGISSAMIYLFRKAGQPGNLTETNLHTLILELAMMLVRILLPFLGANFLVALTNQFLQHGFNLNTSLLVPKFGKINPFSGFKKLFSVQSIANLVKSVLKFIIIATVVYLVVTPRVPAILATMKLPMAVSLHYFQETLFLIYRNILIVMLAMAGADFLYTRFQFEKGLKMTKQEVKDEAKDADGNPLIKGKQRALLLAAAMRRIMTKVPKASVVITNPTGCPSWRTLPWPGPSTTTSNWTGRSPPSSTRPSPRCSPSSSASRALHKIFISN